MENAGAVKLKKHKMNKMKNDNEKNVVRNLVKITPIGEVCPTDMPNESNLFYYAS